MCGLTFNSKPGIITAMLNTEVAPPQFKTNPDRGCAIFVHVPKTGGISLRAAVSQAYGKDRTWLYMASSDVFHRADRMLYQPEETDDLHVRLLKHRLASPIMRSLVAINNRQAASKAEAYGSADAIIGHFNYDAFDNMLHLRPVKQYTVLREPLERTISHYRYLQAHRHRDRRFFGWMKPEGLSLSFEEFALSASVKNFQTKYAGTDFGRYELIGTTEKMNDFMIQIGLIDSTAKMPRYNQTDQKLPVPKISNDAGFISEFKDFHSIDYAMYDKAAAQF